PAEEPHAGGRGDRHQPPGKRGTGSRDKAKLDLPNVFDVREGDWARYGMCRDSSVKVKSTPEAGYDFYVNLDNVHLKTELKTHRQVEPEILESQYRYGMVLLALALLRELADDESGRDKRGLKTHSDVEMVCDALSPFLLPMMSALGQLAA
ncbi:MAG: hypothetical protein IBX63_11110, partial [Coriobacteriia bacterium]|nr:hypothetical protein [Coriobacteriia bacterium]